MLVGCTWVVMMNPISSQHVASFNLLENSINMRPCSLHSDILQEGKIRGFREGKLYKDRGKVMPKLGEKVGKEMRLVGKFVSLP